MTDEEGDGAEPVANGTGDADRNPDAVADEDTVGDDDVASTDDGNVVSDDVAGDVDTVVSDDVAGDDDGAGDDLDDGGVLDAVYDAVGEAGRPLVTAESLARATALSQREATATLSRLTDAGTVERVDVSHRDEVWYPTELGELASRERVVLFPERREIVVDQPTQITRARLSQFAHLVDTTGTDPGTRGYLYRIRPEDVWNAPFEDLADLLVAIRSVLPRRSESLEEWVESQWDRAHRFALRTHEDGYVVLAAENEDLMGNVARQKLPDDALRAPISDTEAWVNEDELATVKRTLYEAGYPVVDERDLAGGDQIEVELTTELRDYQREWVDRFMEKQAGVFVGPPGSGKTVAAAGVLAAVGAETLVLVPSRELAGQWREELLRHTSLTDAHVGEYHGGEKQVRPVTVATYQTAGMDRHRHVFDDREWGLVVLDEAQHVPAPIFRRAADLQSRHRLGLTATPVRESDDETEIYTLVGPPIGTDWSKLFDAGFVAEPEVEIRHVPWRDEEARNAWDSAHGRQRRQLAATNPAKVEEVQRLRDANPDAKTLVFVEYLDQGEAIAEALDAPFVSGETRHARRERLFAEFRDADGDHDLLVVSRVGDEGIDLPTAELAIVASGLGGSRRQGAQRAGRAMRPVGRARVFVLATRGTREEDFARKRMRHLASKGVAVTETSVGNDEGDAIRDDSSEDEDDAGSVVDDDDSGVVDDESGVVDDGSGVVDDESGVVDDGSGVVDDESGVVDDDTPRAVDDDTDD